jgi:hypothetical protein
MTSLNFVEEHYIKSRDYKLCNFKLKPPVTDVTWVDLSLQTEWKNVKKIRRNDIKKSLFTDTNAEYWLVEIPVFQSSCSFHSATASNYEFPIIGNTNNFR